MDWIYQKFFLLRNNLQRYGGLQYSKQNHNLEKSLDIKLLKKIKNHIKTKKRIVIDSKIGNTNRVFGTIISNEVAKSWGAAGLPNDTLRFNLTGSAGQSLEPGQPKA